MQGKLLFSLVEQVQLSMQCTFIVLCTMHHASYLDSKEAWGFTLNWFVCTKFSKKFWKVYFWTKYNLSLLFYLNVWTVTSLIRQNATYADSTEIQMYILICMGQLIQKKYTSNFSSSPSNFQTYMHKYICAHWLCCSCRMHHIFSLIEMWFLAFFTLSIPFI